LKHKDGDNKSTDSCDSVPQAETSNSVSAGMSLSNKHSRLSSDVQATNSRSMQQQTFTVITAPSVPFNTEQQLIFEDQLLQAFVSAGWPFTSIADPKVRKLLSDFIPGAKLPSRQRLSSQVLTREVVRIQGELRAKAQGAFATMQCDGYKDISKAHLIAFMYTATHKVCNLSA